MSEEKPERRVPRRDRGQNDEFEAIVEGQEQQPLWLHVEVSPISPEEDVDVIDAPKYRSLQEAMEAFERAREEKEKNE